MLFEKVNPSHPDKVADRIAGAIVDLAYSKQENPKIAVEVLLGHGNCHIIAETSVKFDKKEIKSIVDRIVNEKIKLDYQEVPQDVELAKNQENGIKCGDNGIFKGCPVDPTEQKLTDMVKLIYAGTPFDGKYLTDNGKITMCQSHIKTSDWKKIYPDWIINPLGDWTGGYNVDTGATNRKLGSDMGRGVTGGGLHGKDLSKADTSVNIYCYLRAKELGRPVEAICNIGDSNVKVYEEPNTINLGDACEYGIVSNWTYPATTVSKETKKDYVLVPYSHIVKKAREYIKSIGGFEKLAEWGLIR